MGWNFCETARIQVRMGEVHVKRQIVQVEKGHIPIAAPKILEETQFVLVDGFNLSHVKTPISTNKIQNQKVIRFIL